MVGTSGVHNVYFEASLTGLEPSIIQKGAQMSVKVPKLVVVKYTL